MSDLYFVRDGAAVLWAGEAIAGTRYQPNIGDLWPDADLAAIGLYRAQPADAIPEGQVALSSSVQIVGGVPKVVNVTGAPPYAGLTKRQICGAIIMAGLSSTPDTFVVTVLEGVADAQAKALALNDWANPPQDGYVRTDPLFNDPTMLQAGGVTSAQIDAMWRLGMTLPA